MKTPDPLNVLPPEPPPQAAAPAQTPEFPVTLNLPKSYTDKDVREMLTDSWRSGSQKASLSVERDVALLSYPPILLHVGGAVKSVRFSWLAAAAPKLRELGWPESVPCHFCGTRRASLEHSFECLVETIPAERGLAQKSIPLSTRNVFIPCCSRCRTRFNQTVPYLRKWKGARRRGMAGAVGLALALAAGLTLGPLIFPPEQVQALLLWMAGLGLLGAAFLVLMITAFIKEKGYLAQLRQLGFENPRRQQGPLIQPLLERHPVMRRFRPCVITLDLQMDAQAAPETQTER